LTTPNQQESNDKKDKQSSDTGDRMRDYAKYSGMAIQMGLIILIGALIGKKLDAYFQLERPYLTVVFSLLSISAALYLVLKDLFVSEEKNGDKQKKS